MSLRSSKKRALFTYHIFLSYRVIWEEKIALNGSSLDVPAAVNATLDVTTEVSVNDTVLSALPTANVANADIESDVRQELVVFYAVILFATLIVYLMRTFGYFRMCLRISLRLHDRLFRGITRATMYFFNTNSSGRILNRFSKDIRTVDTDLPHTLLDCLAVIICLLSNTLFIDKLTSLSILAVCH